jgi:hypothetical protein
VDAPPGTKFRNMMLKIPNTPFELEVTEFSGLELHPVRPRIQDPGASLLHFAVDDLDAALATARKAGAEVVTTGCSPVADEGSAEGENGVPVFKPRFGGCFLFVRLSIGFAAHIAAESLQSVAVLASLLAMNAAIVARHREPCVSSETGAQWQ